MHFSILKKHLISVIVLGIFALLFVGSTGSGSSSSSTPKDPNAWKNESNWSMAYIMMQDFVKQRLKAPSSAKFPGVFDGIEDHVTNLGGQKYRIISYVDAQNAFGTKIRTKFIGEIQQISEDQWQLISLELLE